MDLEPIHLPLPWHCSSIAIFGTIYRRLPFRGRSGRTLSACTSLEAAFNKSSCCKRWARYTWIAFKRSLFSQCPLSTGTAHCMITPKSEGSRFPCQYGCLLSILTHTAGLPATQSWQPHDDLSRPELTAILVRLVSLSVT